MSLTTQFHFFPSWNAEALRIQILHMHFYLQLLLTRVPSHPSKIKSIRDDNICFTSSSKLYTLMKTLEIKTVFLTLFAYPF